METARKFKFEIKGKVQGVYFRKYTKEKADKLGVKGWVQNTSDGAVIGEAQGSSRAISALKTWLSTEGSPRSRILSAKFTEEENIQALAYEVFEIRR